MKVCLLVYNRTKAILQEVYTSVTNSNLDEWLDLMFTEGEKTPPAFY